MSTFESWLKKNLSRVTSSGNFIPEIDGLRFFAIITVILYHVNTHFKRVTGISNEMLRGSLINDIVLKGGLGVEVFFAISGFILALPFAAHYLKNRPKVQLKKYYIRRITRLEPPYLITLTIIFVGSLWWLDKSFTSEWPHFIASFFYLHNIIYDAWSTVNPVAWSLEIEVQFYILAPFLAFLFFSNHSKWIRRLIIIVVILFFVFLNIEAKLLLEALLLRKSLFTALQYFLVGFLMADIYLCDWKNVKPQKLLIWDVFGMISLIGVFFASNRFDYSGYVLFLVSTFILFNSVFKGKLFNKFFTNTYITIIGGMCYTIYLIHYAFLALIMEFTVRLIPSLTYIKGFLLQSLIVIPLLLIVSAITFYLIERPFMFKDWPQRWVKELKPLLKIT